MSSLGNSLSPSYFTSSNKQGTTWLDFKGSYKCGTKDCPFCPCLIKGEGFKSTVSGRNYSVKDFIKSNTRYLIYLITCKICHIQYVGRTTRRWRDRLHDHVCDIQKNHSTNIANHFNRSHGGDLAALQIQGIERVKRPPGEVMSLGCCASGRSLDFPFENTYTQWVKF